MSYFLVRHKVRDFQQWKKVFEDTQAFRQSHGEKGFQVFRNADAPNEVIILCEWESVDAAKRFASAPPPEPDIMQKAGVIDQPDVYFLETALKG